MRLNRAIPFALGCAQRRLILPGTDSISKFHQQPSFLRHSLSRLAKRHLRCELDTCAELRLAPINIKEETFMLYTKNAASEQPARLARLLAIGLLLLLTIAIAPVNSLAQIGTQSYSPTAYGTYAFVGNTVLVGQTAPSSLAGMCGTSQYLTQTATAAGVTLLPLVSGGAVNTSVSSSSEQAQAQANITSINLLGGLISAQAITAVSTTTVDNNGNFQTSTAGSNFSNLIVLGRVYNGTVPANTRINLPLLGYVVLNEQIANVTSYSSTMTVNMVHVYVTVGNLLGLQLGTQVIVSNASSTIYNVFAPGIISGGSYGTQVAGTVLASLASSPTAPEALPCNGTGGSVLTNSQVGVNLPSILTSGTLTDTAESNLTFTNSSGENTSTIQALNLLSGLVTASVMRAQVDASIDQYGNAYVSGEDSYLGISVAGHPEITDSIPQNTSVPLAGLGTLYLKRILYNGFPPSIEVRSLELVVNQTNIFGLPVGLDVIVGDAYISVIPQNIPM